MENSQKNQLVYSNFSFKKMFRKCLKHLNVLFLIVSSLVDQFYSLLISFSILTTSFVRAPLVIYDPWFEVFNTSTIYRVLSLAST